MKTNQRFLKDLENTKCCKCGGDVTGNAIAANDTELICYSCYIYEEKNGEMKWIKKD